MKTYVIYPSLRVKASAVMRFLNQTLEAGLETDTLHKHEIMTLRAELGRGSRLMPAVKRGTADGRTLKDIRRFIDDHPVLNL